MVEKNEVVEGATAQIPEERRCTHVMADGQRCRQRRWAGKELCFQHDPEAAEQRKQQGKRWSHLRLVSATEVQEILARTLEKVEQGRLPVNRAYAVGYLAQLLLGNLKEARREYSGAKTEWDWCQEIWGRVRALDAGTWWPEEEEGNGEGDESTVVSSASPGEEKV